MVVPILYTCQITLFAQETNAEMDRPTNQILRRLECPFEALHTIERAIQRPYLISLSSSLLHALTI
jgi:hypothetical protein